MSFMEQQRHGGPSAGYIASGFWLGLTLGRFLLIPLQERFGENRVVMIYILMAMVLQFIILFPHSIILNSVAVGLVGLIYGPMYPIGSDSPRSQSHRLS